MTPTKKKKTPKRTLDAPVALAERKRAEFLEDLKPVEVTDADLAFPAHGNRMLPPWDAIPEDFKGHSNRWTTLASHWFFKGLEKPKFAPKEAIDARTAVRHLSVCLGLFEPKHEHKIAGVAYLLSLWFEAVAYGDPEVVVREP